MNLENNFRNHSSSQKIYFHMNIILYNFQSSSPFIKRIWIPAISNKNYLMCLPKTYPLHMLDNHFYCFSEGKMTSVPTNISF